MDACSKREILASIASQYDVFNFNGPLLNRARIFTHELQVNHKLSWDTKLSTELVRQWKNIVRQTNSSLPLEIKRFLGEREVIVIIL